MKILHTGGGYTMVKQSGGNIFGDILGSLEQAAPLLAFVPGVGPVAAGAARVGLGIGRRLAGGGMIQMGSGKGKYHTIKHKGGSHTKVPTMAGGSWFSNAINKIKSVASKVAAGAVKVGKAAYNYAAPKVSAAWKAVSPAIKEALKEHGPGVAGAVFDAKDNKERAAILKGAINRAADGAKDAKLGSAAARAAAGNFVGDLVAQRGYGKKRPARKMKGGSMPLSKMAGGSRTGLSLQVMNPGYLGRSPGIWSQAGSGMSNPVGAGPLSGLQVGSTVLAQ
jgi:hypothetical protein